MMAFGGAGPVHAFQVARLLGAQSVVVPVGAGVTSALGFLTTPVATERTQSHVQRLDRMNWDAVNDTLAAMEEEGRAFLRRADVPEGKIEVERRADMRYGGQGHEITVSLPDGHLSTDTVSQIVENFEAAYRTRYGRLVEDAPIESVTWRVLVKEPPQAPTLRPTARATDAEARKGARQVRFPERDEAVECPVYDRYALAPDTRIDGPAIVEERESTVVAGPGSTVTVDPYRNLVVDLPQNADAAPRTVGAEAESVSSP
jgi:N-methylhydantoinase A